MFVKTTMTRLIFTNLFFALLLAIFLLLPITSNWAWLGLIVSWCAAEGVLARSPELKWWHFALLFAVLGTLEVALVYYVTYWR